MIAAPRHNRDQGVTYKSSGYEVSTRRHYIRPTTATRVRVAQPLGLRRLPSKASADDHRSADAEYCLPACLLLIMCLSV